MGCPCLCFTWNIMYNAGYQHYMVYATIFPKRDSKNTKNYPVIKVLIINKLKTVKNHHAGESLKNDLHYRSTVISEPY